MAVLTLGATILLPYPAFAQSQTSSESVNQDAADRDERREIDKFLALRDRRAKLLSEIPRLRGEVQTLEIRQRELTNAESVLRNNRLNLEAARAERPPDQKKISYYDSQVKNLEEQISRAKTDYPDGIPRAIQKAGEQLRAKESQLESVETDLSELLNRELARQKFKQLMSMVFAGLVGLVIVGFFVLAWVDETVRQAIFKGQAGIQFVTLFSLVIAIILFGITGILEGKELAALLGGLSGYILGRVTS